VVVQKSSGYKGALVALF